MFTRTEIEKQILASYAQTRADNEQKANSTLQFARKNKEFSNEYLTIKDLEFKIAEATFKNQDAKELKTSLSRHKTKLKQIIKSLGLKEKDFEVQYNCKSCKDTGFVENKQCTCFRSKVNEQLIQACGLEIAKLNTFDEYDPSVAPNKEQQESMQQLKDYLLAYISKFPNVRICNMVITGPTGVGKTFALECTTSEILKKGHTANFLTAFQMNNQFLKYHTCFDANKQSYLNILLDPDLLVIDDLGTEPILKNVTIEYLYLVISERMLKHKATLISTNLGTEHIMDRYGERIFSRLFDKAKSLAFQITGSDIRRLKRSNNN